MFFHKPLITTLLFPTTVLLLLLPYYLTMFVVSGQEPGDECYMSFVGGPGSIPGNDQNTNSAQGYSFVGAGAYNTAKGYASFVGAGDSNSAQKYSFVGAGYNNTAQGYYSVISGGMDNNASGISAAIIGGEGNQASGFYSIAMGFKANANKDRSLVINLGKKLKQVSSKKAGEVLVNSDFFTIQIGKNKVTINKKNIKTFAELLKKGDRRHLEQQPHIKEQQSIINKLQQQNDDLQATIDEQQVINEEQQGQNEKLQEQINELYRMITAARSSTAN